MTAGQLMDSVFVKKGSSKSYTNLITSSASIPLKQLSQEPIGQQQRRQQQPLGINNVETQTTHKRKKSYSWRVLWLLLVNPPHCNIYWDKQEYSHLPDYVYRFSLSSETLLLFEGLLSAVTASADSPSQTPQRLIKMARSQ